MGRGPLQQAFVRLRSVARSRKRASANGSLKRKRFYYPELDAVRVFLFAGVWCYHALPRDESYYIARHVPVALASLIAGTIRAGMCSLDVFFILSAFLITELLLREKESQGTVDLKTFYIRRLLRIWPLYFFVIGLAGLLSMFDRTQPLAIHYALGFLLFAGNWIIIRAGYPGASMIGPLWSVSFEEQFYLLWPLVLRKASRAAIYVIVVGLLVTATSVRTALLLRHVHFGSLWYNTFVRLDSIVAGILLAMILHKRNDPQLGCCTRAGLIFVGLLTWFVVGRYCGLHQAVPPLVGGLVGYPLMSLGGIIVFLSVLGASKDGLPFMGHPVLVYLGKISYGLYAFHILALRGAYYLFRHYHHAFHMSLSSLVALAITFGMAAASFRWLESPFLRLKQKKFTYIPSGPVLDAPKENSSNGLPKSSEIRQCSELDAPQDSAAREANPSFLSVSRGLASSSIEP